MKERGKKGEEEVMGKQVRRRGNTKKGGKEEGMKEQQRKQTE